jgi:hypothetical protein
MSAFHPAPSVACACLARRSGWLALTGRLAATPRATIALLMPIVGIGAGPFSIAQSRPIDLSDQEIGVPPRAFAFWRAGRTDVGHWTVVGDAVSAGGTVIQRSDTDRSVQTALAVYTPLSARDGRIRTRFELIAGSTPSAGVALRIIDPGDYYLVRASADEQRCLAGGAVPLEGEQSALDRRDRGGRVDRLSVVAWVMVK